VLLQASWGEKMANRLVGRQSNAVVLSSEGAMRKVSVKLLNKKKGEGEMAVNSTATETRKNEKQLLLKPP